MSTTATTQLTPGIYFIVVARGVFESQRLTDGDNYLTILPRSVFDEPKQEVIHYFQTSSIVCRSPAHFLSFELIMAKMVP